MDLWPRIMISGEARLTSMGMKVSFVPVEVRHMVPSITYRTAVPWEL